MNYHDLLLSISDLENILKSCLQKPSFFSGLLIFS